MLRRLRAELAAATELPRQARLLGEIGEIEEQAGDEANAARDYLAAYRADATFREPLEGIARLIARRPSSKTLAGVFEALVDEAGSPDERVRALLMRAAHEADTLGDLSAAIASVRQATEVVELPVADAAAAWLTLEILAGRTGDPLARAEALAARSERASGDREWAGLLLVDRARLAAAAGEVQAAAALLEEARTSESEATWTATTLLEQLLHEAPGEDAGEYRERAELRAVVLEAIAGLVHVAVVAPARGDVLGVPRWAREPGRAVDAWLRAAEERRALGQLDGAASALNRALFVVDHMTGADGRLADSAVAHARIRLAEQIGDTALAAQLAAKRLASEKDGPLAAALALRVAEHAAAEGDSKGAVEALAKAVANDPGCLPAWALELDILADSGDGVAFSAQFEAFAGQLATDEARSRAFLLTSYVWAVRGHDPGRARAALLQAKAFGADPEVIARLARMLASIGGDAVWYEDATRQLVALSPHGREGLSLHAELLRLCDARGDREGSATIVRAIAAIPGIGAWFARMLETFSPESAAGSADPDHASRNDALDALAAEETDPQWVTSLEVVSVLRRSAAGDTAGARQKLQNLVSRFPEDATLAAYLGDLDRARGDHQGAAQVAKNAAAATNDAELAAAFHIEAAFEMWRSGQPKEALDEITSALGDTPEAARIPLAWASWGASPKSAEERRQALHNTQQSAGDPQAIALELFAIEVASGDVDAAGTALREAEGDGYVAGASAHTDKPQALAAALARIMWSAGAAVPGALDAAIEHVERRGPRASAFAAAERVRLAREGGDTEAVARAARKWFQAGGQLPAAIEWLAASTAIGDIQEEMEARLATAAALDGEAQETMVAGAALLQTRIEVDRPVALADGKTPAVRLTNLELAPPGCDPRRRATVLVELDGELGDDAAVDAEGMAGWSRFAARDFEGARGAFERTIAVRPEDLAAWEGLRLCAERTGKKDLWASAAAQLGARCAGGMRGAAFWEEAAVVWLDLGEDAKADDALDASFARDPRRAVAFDRMFRRVRDRKDNPKLLAIIARRLTVTDDPQEIQKLSWEQARALRELGDQDGALKALENVTSIDPDHVGALALLGEINLRRGRFEEAATALARLAMHEGGPPKNRVTAGVAAVDIYENKLSRFDKALEILLSLHRAKISTLPVRERLARAAARTGSWTDATTILDELMRERPDSAGRIEAARLSIAIHRDRLGDAQGGAAAIVALLDEDPTDGEALDMLRQTEQPSDTRDRLLGKARLALIARTEETPTDAESIHKLVTVADDLKDAGLHQAALGVLSALGISDAQAEQTFAQLVAKKQRVPRHVISGPVFRSGLAPGDAGPISDLFLLLGPTLADALGPNAQACGVSRRDRVDPRSGLMLRNEVAAWAAAFGIVNFDFYVGGKDPLGIQGISGDPPAIVVGAGVNAPLAPVTRARVARELLGLLRGTSVLRTRDDVTIDAIVIAACHVADVPVTARPYAVQPEIDKLVAKAMPRKIRKQIVEPCRAIVSRGADPRSWSKRALASHDRFSTIASGDPSVVLSDILGVPVERLGPAVAGNPRAVELLRFVLSREYLDVRGALGLEKSS